MKTYKQFMLESAKKRKDDDAVEPKNSTYHPFFAGIGSGFLKHLGEDTSFDAYSIDAPKHELHRELHEHYKFSADDKAHIKNYTSDSAPINKSLIHNHKNPTDFFSRADHEVGFGKLQKGLDGVLSKHKTAKAMHVYSGAGMNPERFHKSDEDHINLHLPAYTSTSIERPVAERFAKFDEESTGDHKYGGHRHLLRIHVPEGHEGAYLGEHSNYHKEREFTLPRDTKLKVNPTPTVHQPEPGWQGRTQSPVAIWHATIHKE